MHKAFTEPNSLIKGKVVVFATHRVSLVQQLAKQFVEVTDGRLCVTTENPISDSSASTPPREKINESAGIELADDKNDDDKEPASKFIEDEHREEGGIQARVWITFIMSAKWGWLSLGIAMFTVRIIAIARTWFYKAWGEAYSKGTTSSHFAMMQSVEKHDTSFIPTNLHDPIGTLMSFNPGDWLAPPTENLMPWLVIMFALSTANSVAGVAYAASQMFAGKY